MEMLHLASFSSTASVSCPNLSESPSPLHILHVEDDENDALLCHRHLEEAGLAVETKVVTSRAEFLGELRSKPYDIVLTDFKLPGWSGMEVLRALEKENRDIPCILVTGSVGEEIAAKCIKLGATDYILKDRPTRLPFAISSALEEKKEREKRKEAERSRNRLAAIVECSLDAIIAAADDGNILSWNPGAAAMFGYSPEEVLGTPLATLFTPDEGGGVGDAIHRYETRGKTKNGEQIDLAVTISPILNPDGSSDGCSAIVRDVTETKRQQRDLLTAQKLEAIGQLAGGIAHDFNNLLTVINGYARMMQKKGSGDPAKIDAIVQAGERGQRLTKQLLVFSRKQITQSKPIHLNALVLGMLDILSPLVGDEIRLQTRLCSELACVLADYGQMEQVLMNLVVNARDAMPEGGVITIETANASDTVTLSVADSGIGMSPEVQARIFEPFFTTKEVGRGTGLGLSTCCGIVAQSKGKLQVASELGRGTRFTVELPACNHPLVLAGDSSASAPSAIAKATGTILLAEDDPTVRAFVVSVLRDHGYHVLAAENGSKALDLCVHHAGPIHALVTDVVMPEMNGRVLVERARLVRPDLKVLFVSGYVDRGLKDEDIALLSSSFLEKPFTGEALLQIVDGFCAEAMNPPPAHLLKPLNTGP